MAIKRRKRRKFNTEFKQEVAELCLRDDRSIGQVSRDLGIRLPPVSELRKSPRYNVAFEVGVDADAQFYAGHSQNISRGGIFISCTDPLPIGDCFRITFRLPGIDHAFSPTCESRWIHQPEEDETDPLGAGMGASFSDLTFDEEDLIDEYIQKIETLYIEDDATF